MININRGVNLLLISSVKEMFTIFKRNTNGNNNLNHFILSNFLFIENLNNNRYESINIF